MGARWGDGLRLAFGTFTALPTPHPRTVDRDRWAVAVLAAVLPGAVLGVIGAVVAVAAVRLGVPDLAAATLAVAAVQFACRGFHLDGLGDTADGLAAGFDRERALQVMRSGDAGPAAIASTLLVLLGQVSALAALLPRPGWQGATAFVVAVALARGWVILPCLGFVPLARPKGLGAGAGRSVAPAAGLVVVLLQLLAASALLLLAGFPVWAGAVVAVAGAGTAALTVWHVVRRLGGVTGDVMGAVVELTLTAMLITVSAC